MSWLKCNATLHTHTQSLKQNKRLSVTYFCKSHFSKSSWIIWVFQACCFQEPSLFPLKWMYWYFKKMLQFENIPWAPTVKDHPCHQFPWHHKKKKIKKFLCKKARQRKPDNGSSLFADKGWHRNENYLMASPRYLYYQWPVRVNDAKFSRFLSRYLTTKQLYSYPGHCCEILSFGHCYRDQPLSSGWKCLMQSRC